MSFSDLAPRPEQPEAPCIPGAPLTCVCPGQPAPLVPNNNDGPINGATPSRHSAVSLHNNVPATHHLKRESDPGDTKRASVGSSKSSQPQSRKSLLARASMKLQPDAAIDMEAKLKELEKLQKGDQKENKTALASMYGISMKVGNNMQCEEQMLQEMEEKEQYWRLFLYRVMRSQRFDAAMGFLIIVNSITLGMESSFEIKGLDISAFEDLEHVYLTIYLIELCCRFYTQRIQCLACDWVKFDLLLVGLGVVTTWIMPMVLAIMSAAGGDTESAPNRMGYMMVLRVFRLFRLARALRILVQFRTLWMLCRGMTTSIGKIFYTFVLIFILLYIGACIVMELITKPGIEDDIMRPFVEAHWSDIPSIMLTLLQFVFLDSIGEIYRPLVMYQPALICVFVPFLLTVSVALMNLVTALLVEGALEQGKQDKDVQKAYKAAEVQKLMPDVLAMFHSLDTDGDGSLSLTEITESQGHLKEELMTYMNAENLAELFEMIDVDGSGEVSIEEFCDGISKLASSDRPVELIRILKHSERMRARQDTMARELRAFVTKTESRLGQLDSLQESQQRLEQSIAEVVSNQKSCMSSMEQLINNFCSASSSSKPGIASRTGSLQEARDESSVSRAVLADGVNQSSAGPSGFVVPSASGTDAEEPLDATPSGLAPVENDAMQ